MSQWESILSDAVAEILATTWNERDGRVVPESETVSLADGAVKIDATFLYADLAGSSKLATFCPWQTTAKIIRAYLDVSTRLIRAWKGEIRSFDGDRVMGVFKDGYKNTNAANCAREIDWTVENVIGPQATAEFKSVRNNGIKLTHCVGIDTGVSRAVRAGIRNNNDLVWIGKAPSFAAKLSDVRKYPYSVYLSSRAFKNMTTEAKAETYNGVSIWDQSEFVFAGAKEAVYRTKSMKTP